MNIMYHAVALHSLGAVALFALASAAPGHAQAARPNILFAITDDQSWAHTGAAGDPVVRTPNFDRIAKEGVLFSHAFVSSPSCSPSRAAALTGRNFWELGQGSNLWALFPSDIVDYPDMLEGAGYAIAHGGKGWGPGAIQDGARNPAGPQKEFTQFISGLPKGKPFCYWYGSSDPHRPYIAGSGAAAGLDQAKVKVPAHLPDHSQVRQDMLDYFAEIEKFDRALGGMLGLLEQQGLLENTLVVVTSDNGMPFPRSKSNLYDHGIRVPLSIRWPAKVKGGRVIDDFVSSIDLAPTFLEAAGIPIPRQFRGRSLMGILGSDRQGRVDPSRNQVYAGVNRHAYARENNQGYPMRAIRTRDYLFIRNFLPNRWPAGNPPDFRDIDDGPTKTFLMEHRNEPSIANLFNLAMANRPAEELYDLRQDPAQIYNVAGLPAFSAVKSGLSARLLNHLTETGDPLATQDPESLDGLSYVGESRQIAWVAPGSPFILPAPFSGPVSLARPRYFPIDAGRQGSLPQSPEAVYDGLGVRHRGGSGFKIGFGAQPKTGRSENPIPWR